MTLLLPAHLRQNSDYQPRAFVLTDQQSREALLLSSETIAWVENRISTLSALLLEIRFSGLEDSRFEQMLEHSAIVGSITILKELLSECEAAYGEAQQIMQQSGHIPGQQQVLSPEQTVPLSAF